MRAARFAAFMGFWLCLCTVECWAVGPLNLLLRVAVMAVCFLVLREGRRA